jgi:hypothetical protein
MLRGGLRLFCLIVSILCINSVFGQGPDSEQAATGPTLKLSYSSDPKILNPVDAFMYFVPLTSPTSIVASTETGTTLSAAVTSWEAKKEGGKVHLKCNFQVSGTGSYCAFYDPAEMIQLCREENSSKLQEITRLLEWIRLSGPCQGQIKGIGKQVGSDVEMEYIEVVFNHKNTVSPVEVSIYDIPPVKGEYSYDNRRNCKIARINSLKFRQCDDGVPRMTVELASVKKADAKEGFLSGLTAMIANILSTSTPVSPVGNSTMMEFGRALYEQESAFTFPRAENFTLQL